ncbi:MAG: hypothetical protein ACC726_06990 [Chloroflexota bacterium]
MSGIKQAVFLGAIPIVVAIAYLIFQEAAGDEAIIDAAGVTMLIALGLAIGFGMLVILRGARDL